MQCRMQELKHKEVVCVQDGCLLGPISDVEFDTETAKVISIVIYGRPRFFGIMGREDDYIIPWSNIEVIGEDTVLVNCANIPHRKKSFLNLQNIR